MNAKDYAIKYNQLLQTTDIVEAEIQIVKLLVDETRQIMTMRNCKTVDTYLAVMREMQQKWLAVCKLTNTYDFIYEIGIKAWNEPVYNIAVKGNVFKGETNVN